MWVPRKYFTLWMSMHPLDGDCQPPRFADYCLDSENASQSSTSTTAHAHDNRHTLPRGCKLCFVQLLPEPLDKTCKNAQPQVLPSLVLQPFRRGSAVMARLRCRIVCTFSCIIWPAPGAAAQGYAAGSPGSSLQAGAPLLLCRQQLLP